MLIVSWYGHVMLISFRGKAITSSTEGRGYVMWPAVSCVCLPVCLSVCPSVCLWMQDYVKSTHNETLQDRGLLLVKESIRVGSWSVS